MLEISYPVDKGIVQNWSDMEHLWDYTFARMGVRYVFCACVPYLAIKRVAHSSDLFGPI